jgi:diaminopimelate epimerase
MKFFKYHGLGNDFVVIDGTDGKTKVDNAWCKKVCDRNFGIGADGVLYILPGSDGAEISMRIVNADGTEAEMCGNGIRCVAKHVFDRGIVDKTQFSIHTLAGILEATLTVTNGKTATVRINMGAPILDCSLVPMDRCGRFIDAPLEVCGRTVTGNAVSMGNPHFVTFDRLSDADIAELGPALEHHSAFPRKTNVEFAVVDGGSIDIKVYERGAAWTMACGTGACATTTAAALNGLVPFNMPVKVHLPGGWLNITVDKDLKYVLMEGPAEFVFEGTIAV